MKEIINVAKSLFSDMQKSPYRERIIPVLDSVHGKDIVGNLVRMGLRKENIVVWDNNGIEYYYPSSILDNIFGTGDQISIEGDKVSKNGINYNKAELADMVCNKITNNSEYPQEFLDKFIALIERTTGLSSRFSP